MASRSRSLGSELGGELVDGGAYLVGPHLEMGVPQHDVLGHAVAVGVGGAQPRLVGVHHLQVFTGEAYGRGS